MMINTQQRPDLPAVAARWCGADTMAASIAHEVTQPLAAISLNAHAALRCFLHDRSSAQLHAALLALVEASSQANAIVHSIRSLSAQRRQAPAGARLDHILDQLLKQMNADVRRHRIDVQVDLAHAERRLRADPVQLHQVLRNLLANAIESMHAVDRPRRLAIDTRPDGAGSLLITVSDSGAGFTGDGAMRAFDPLYSTRAEGMGMGLAICRSIVAAHGGRIWATAGEAHGAMFRFTMPFDDAPAPSYP